MARVVSLYLPTWATDRRKRRSGVASPQPEGGLALAAHDGRRRVVVAADLVAQQAGVRIGMPATKAQILVPGLTLEDADLAADLESLDALAGWMLRYSPIVGADPPDGVVLDTTGADHLRGGEEAMLEGLVVRLAASGFDARAAVADTWGVAHGLARFGSSRIVIAEAGAGEAVIASLPLGALRLPREIVAGLRTLGFDKVGDLLGQPRAPLVLRFGPELGRRLDQALGHVREPIEPIRPPNIVEVQRAFAEPIGAAETIARYVGKLVGDLCTQLEARGLGVRHLDLICERVDSRTQAVRVMTALARYAELQVTSHFSFLRGASSADELFATAAILGIEALAVVDRNSLAGIVRAHEAAKATGVRLIVGCRLDLAEGMSVLVYPTDRPAYSRLCRLLTHGKKRGGKARCVLEWADLVAYGEGLIAVFVPDQADEICGVRLRRLRDAFGDRAFMALTLRRRPNDQMRLHELSNLAARMRVPTVVTNDVLFHEPGRRMLQDVVTCIRHNVTIDELGQPQDRAPPRSGCRLRSSGRQS